MKELSRRIMQRAILVNGVEQPAPSATIVLLELPNGERQEVTFDHDPTDDELLTLAPEPQPRRIRASNAAERVEGLAELSARYISLRQMTELADFATLFTLQERNRITNARDFVLTQIKAYV